LAGGKGKMNRGAVHVTTRVKEIMVSGHRFLKEGRSHGKGRGNEGHQKGSLVKGDLIHHPR